MKIEGVFGHLDEKVGLLGDYNGDTYNDLLLSGGNGIFIISGLDGTKLNHIPTGSKYPESVIGIDDIDADNIPDVVVGNKETVRAYSSVTGNLLWSYEGEPNGVIGRTLENLGDVDGDGISDVAAGEPLSDSGGFTNTGKLNILSGDTGTLIYIVEGTHIYEGLGSTIDVIDDLNDDGINDLLVGDDMTLQPSPAYGRVQALSGVDGSEIFTITSTIPDNYFGTQLANAGDINNDGVHDIAIASLDPDTLYVYSGANPTGSPIWTKQLDRPGQLLCVGDLNDDNIPDMASAIPSSWQATLELIDGATGNVINTLTSSDYGFEAIVSPGDVTGDGKPEIFSALFSTSPFEPSWATAFELPHGDTHFTVSNPLGGTNLGSAVGVAGDLDEDGLDDIIVGSGSRLMVFAGDGSGPILDETVGINYSLISTDTMGFDDLTGDGIPEVFISDGYWPTYLGDIGRILVISGADGSVVAEYQGDYAPQKFGANMEPTIDFNGDGVRDFYASATGATVGTVQYAGEVYLVSGATGEILQVFQGLGTEFGFFGGSLSTGGDIDEDGVPDLGVGSADKDWYNVGIGVFYIFSGATGEILYQIESATGSRSLQGDIIGDASGDGVADFICSEVMWQRPGEPAEANRGRVRGFSGVDGSLLWQLEGLESDDLFGSDAKGVGDVNGDGYADVAIAANYGGTDNEGEFFIFSGKDGAMLDRMDLPSRPAVFASINSFDEGASSDLILGMPDLNNNGGAYIYASSEGGVHGFKNLGHSLPGTPPAAPQLKGYGSLGVGDSFSIEVRRVLPDAFGYWFISANATELPFKGGTFVPDPYPYLLTFPLWADSEGEFSFSTTVPSSIPGGSALVHQFWFQDPGGKWGASATNGLMEIFEE